MQAREHWRKVTSVENMDPSSMGEFSSDKVLRCIQVGLLCAQEVPTDRPPMSSVFLMLHGPSTATQEPLQPKFAGGINMGLNRVIQNIRIELN